MSARELVPEEVDAESLLMVMAVMVRVVVQPQQVEQGLWQTEEAGAVNQRLLPQPVGEAAKEPGQ